MEEAPEKRILSWEEHIKGPQEVSEEMVEKIIDEILKDEEEGTTREEVRERARRLATQRLRDAIKKETGEN